MVIRLTCRKSSWPFIEHSNTFVLEPIWKSLCEELTRPCMLFSALPPVYRSADHHRRPDTPSSHGRAQPACSWSAATTRYGIAPTSTAANPGYPRTATASSAPSASQLSRRGRTGGVRVLPPLPQMRAIPEVADEHTQKHGHGHPHTSPLVLWRHAALAPVGALSARRQTARPAWTRISLKEVNEEGEEAAAGGKQQRPTQPQPQPQPQWQIPVGPLKENAEQCLSDNSGKEMCAGTATRSPFSRKHCEIAPSIMAMMRTPEPTPKANRPATAWKHARVLSKTTGGGAIRKVRRAVQAGCRSRASLQAIQLRAVLRALAHA